VKRIVFIPSKSFLASLLTLALLNCFSPSVPAANKLNVVTATTDLASLVQEIGGDRVEVDSIARGYQDPHFVEANRVSCSSCERPTCWSSLAWSLKSDGSRPLSSSRATRRFRSERPAILTRRVLRGYWRYQLDRSLAQKVTSIPWAILTTGSIRKHGLRIAKGIENKISEMHPADADYFAQRYTAFEQRLKQADQQWLAEMKPYAGRKIVTYHRSWPNFAEHFHLEVDGYVEPRPGIPPSPQHTVELIQLMSVTV